MMLSRWPLTAALAALAIASTVRAGTVSYAYDALGRLIAVTYANGSTTTYGYDPAGNMTDKTVGSVSARVAANSQGGPATRPLAANSSAPTDPRSPLVSGRSSDPARLRSGQSSATIKGSGQ